ncbi:protein draper isoform X2 [Halyomorpha halys]|nr:protein draper-like [Halyomorpha halys]
MNGLLSILVSVLIFNTFKCQEQNNFLEGPNVCTRQELYNVTKRVEEIKPTIVKSYVWCMKIPPRCSLYETQNATIYVDKVVTEVRNVDECCKGYMVFGRNCVPICSNGCGNGSCIAPEICECEVGYTGQNCNEVCPRGSWGMGCRQNCICNDGSCDPFSGQCMCPPGRIGEICEAHCPEGKYGNGCLNDCLCRNEARCHPETGQCICRPGYTGALCEMPCQVGYYGEQCALECHCPNSISCDPVTGACSCPQGYTGLNCENPCKTGWYGENCKNPCNCHNNATCDNVYGSCACFPGYRGEKCQEKCPAGSFGENCLQTCDCNGANCNHVTGECNCPESWTGKHCDQQVCPVGYYGSNCDQLCHCECNDTKTNMETSIMYPGTFLHTKHKYSRFVETRTLTEQDRLIFNYVTDGDYKSLADLCAQGVNMNIADINNNYQTPLHLAAKNGCVFTMLTVMGCGVNINAMDGDGNTPLHLAVDNNQFHICSSLLYNEANPFIYNTDMKTPYQLAMDSESNWIKYFFQENRLKWYKKVRKLNRDEKKMFLGVKRGHYGTVADLCIKGVDIQVANEENKQNTPFHYAAYYAKNVAPMVLTILRCGGNINVKNSDGNTPLHVAVIRGHFNATSTLLQYGANPFIENNEGKMAHELATESSDPNLQTLFNEPLLSWYLNTHFVL